MKLIGACLAVVAVGSLWAADDPKDKDWVKVAPEGGKCEILFPAKPTEKAQKDSTQVILERENGKVALMLQYNELPKQIDVGSADAVKVVLNGGRDGLKNAFKGSKIVSEKDFKFADKYPARDIDMEVPQLGIYRVRFILTGPKFYQVTVLGPKDYMAGAESKKFWESFKLKE